MNSNLATIFSVLALALPTVHSDAAKPASAVVDRAGELVLEKSEKKWRLHSPDKKHTLFVTLTEEHGWSEELEGFADKRTLQAEIAASGIAPTSLGLFERATAALWSPTSDAFSIGGIGDDMRLVKIYVSVNGVFEHKEVPYENPALDGDIGRPARAAQTSEKFAGWLKDGGFQTKQNIAVQFRSDDGSELLDKGEVLDYLVTYTSPTSEDFRAKSAKLLKRKPQKF